MPLLIIIKGGVVKHKKQENRLIKAFDWFARYDLVRTLITAKYPTILALATAGLGFATNQSYMWIAMASSLVFMAVTVGYVYARAWKDSKNPQHKLIYVCTAVNYDLLPLNRHQNRQSPKSTVVRKLDKTQIGVALRNNAGFPISVILHSADTEMEELKPARTPYPKSPTIVLPGNTMHIMDTPIPMNALPCAKLEGKMKLEIKYGLPGNEVYDLNFNARVEALMQPVGFINGIYTHWESDTE